MVLHTHTTKAVLLVALTIGLTACGKQDERAAASMPAAASASAFPTGNADKVMTLADCDKLPDPKPADESAAGRAAAVGQGQSARADCKRAVAAKQDKANADLARIREIKEKEDAAGEARRVSEAEWKRGIKEGAKQPIKEYKY
jgi:hypothetical protein